MQYQYKDLLNFTTSLFAKCGLNHEMSDVTARTLIEADLMGHTTHGLSLLALYVEQLKSGQMTVEGYPETIIDSGSAVCWNGNYLPGPWLVHEAMDLAFQRIPEHPVVTITIQKSHHIGCLAAYPEKATKKGLVMILSCSDPKNISVAPFGGMTGVYSPNPIAAGFPTEGDPIVFDVSMSETAVGTVMRSKNQGSKLAQKYLLTNEGRPSDDPEEYFKDPPATILPLGGMTSGYKGFALGIMVEALTSALGGHGRSNTPNKWGASVFLQIINPEAFGGLAHFKKEMQYLVDKSLQSRKIDSSSPVRIPGQRALELKREQLKHGVQLHPAIVNALKEVGAKNGIELPMPIKK